MNQIPIIYLNENIPYTIKPYLTRLCISHVHTLDVKNQGVSDEFQLNFTTANNYMIVTFNRRDFRKLHKKWLSVGKVHPGIILLSPKEPSILAKRLENFLDNKLALLKIPFCELAT